MQGFLYVIAVFGEMECQFDSDALSDRQETRLKKDKTPKNQNFWFSWRLDKFLRRLAVKNQ
ncbi:MAG: hypothetical protein CVU44_17895 [Chloroflexi bacterium HGW-Chloroflexi-6]|nr:MAG: hypothetical protein CVU44_17895 [Chloroflexi bacterium HGW-Chloroflexi-6]